MKKILIVCCIFFPLIESQPKIGGYCYCPWKYTPVCGSDGKTYDNDCELICASRMDEGFITKRYNGMCNKQITINQEIPCFCSDQPMFVKPVCEINFKTNKRITFKNECFWRCARRNQIKELLVEGACEGQVYDDGSDIRKKWLH